MFTPLALIEEFIKNHMNFINATGFFSETVVFIIVVCVLFGIRIQRIFPSEGLYGALIQHYYLVVFLFGALVSVILNRSLKEIFKGERPKDPIKFLDSERFSKTNAPYGMPSGHTQFLFFCIAFLFMACTTCGPWIALSFVIALTAFYERYVFHNHTMPQLLVGAIVGTVLGLSVYEAALYGFSKLSSIL